MVRARARAMARAMARSLGLGIGLDLGLGLESMFTLSARTVFAGGLNLT